MPLPTPNAREDKNRFVARCMSNAAVKKEFPDQKQRVAVCHSQWNRNKSKVRHSAMDTVYLRTPPMYHPKPVGVDRENGVIFGAAVATVGKVKSYDYFLDEYFCDQVVDHGNKTREGTKVRFGHPNMSAPGIGHFLGRATNFRRDNNVTRADIKLSQTAHKAPAGNGVDLYEYVLDLVENEASAVGLSLVFKQAPPKIVKEKQQIDAPVHDKDGEVIEGKTQKKEVEVTKKFARLDVLRAVDTVDDPAANPDGMFSVGSLVDIGHSFAAIATDFLDENPEFVRLLSENSEVVDDFLARYNNYQRRQDEVQCDDCSLEQRSLDTDMPCDEHELGKGSGRVTFKPWDAGKVRRQAKSAKDLLPLIPPPIAAYLRKRYAGRLDDIPKNECRLPHHELNGDVNAHGVRAAKGYLPKTRLPSGVSREACAAHLDSHDGAIARARKSSMSEEVMDVDLDQIKTAFGLGDDTTEDNWAELVKQKAQCEAAELKTQLDSVTQERDQLNAKVEQKKAADSSMSDKLVLAEQKLSEMDKQLQDARQKIAGQELGKLRGRIDAAKSTGRLSADGERLLLGGTELEPGKCSEQQLTALHDKLQLVEAFPENAVVPMGQQAVVAVQAVSEQDEEDTKRLEQMAEDNCKLAQVQTKESK